MSRAVRWVLAGAVMCGVALAEPLRPEIDPLKIPISRQIVASTHLTSVGYAEKAQVLEVEFQNGAVYRYLRVPITIYVGLLGAKSKGQFFARNIRKRFEFHQISKPTP